MKRTSVALQLEFNGRYTEPVFGRIFQHDIPKICSMISSLARTPVRLAYRAPEDSSLEQVMAMQGQYFYPEQPITLETKDNADVYFELIEKLLLPFDIASIKSIHTLQGKTGIELLSGCKYEIAVLPCTDAPQREE